MQDAEPIYAAMRASEMLAWVGGGDPAIVGRTNRDLTKHITGIRSPKTILDFGCGIGRTTAAFLEDSEFTGHLMGIDIVPQMVDFCNQTISTRCPNSRFYCTDSSNIHYDDRKLSCAQTIHESALLQQIAGTVDLAIAFSVFTHLSETQAAHVLSLLSTALIPDGKLLLTAFLLDDESRTALTSQLARMPGAASPAAMCDDFYSTPDQGIVFYSERRLAEIASLAGLRISARAHGNWRGENSAFGMAFFQDALCLEKSAGAVRLPTGFDADHYVSLHPDLKAAGVSGARHYLDHGHAEGRRWR